MLRKQPRDPRIFESLYYATLLLQKGYIRTGPVVPTERNPKGIFAFVKKGEKQE